MIREKDPNQSTRSHRWYILNRELHIARNKEYRELHHQEMLEYDRRRYPYHKIYNKIWSTNNRDKKRIYHHRSYYKDIEHSRKLNRIRCKRWTLRLKIFNTFKRRNIQ